MQPSTMRRILATANYLLLLLMPPGLVADSGLDFRITRELEQLPPAEATLVRLGQAPQQFIALHLPADRPPARGAVVLLHDAWGSPDSREITGPLRRGLARAGWETLALQLPTALRGEDPASWGARTEALSGRIALASEWLKTRELDPPALIAPGASAALALAYATSLKPGELPALVLISSRAALSAEQRESLARSETPVLDVVAEHDDPAIVDAALTRHRAAAQTDGMSLQARRVTGARAGFPNTDDALIATVRAWLAHTTAP